MSELSSKNHSLHLSGDYPLLSCEWVVTKVFTLNTHFHPHYIHQLQFFFVWQAGQVAAWNLCRRDSSACWLISPRSRLRPFFFSFCQTLLIQPCSTERSHFPSPHCLIFSHYIRGKKNLSIYYPTGTKMSQIIILWNRFCPLFHWGGSGSQKRVLSAVWWVTRFECK